MQQPRIIRLNRSQQLVKNDRFIGFIENGTQIGYKYFEFSGKEKLRVTTRGKGQGKFLIAAQMDGLAAAEIPIIPSKDWLRSEEGALAGFRGRQALYFKYAGDKQTAFLEMEFC